MFVNVAFYFHSKEPLNRGLPGEQLETLHARFRHSSILTSHLQKRYII